MKTLIASLITLVVLSSRLYAEPSSPSSFQCSKTGGGHRLTVRSSAVHARSLCSQT
jgi:hypothetical protein